MTAQSVGDLSLGVRPWTRLSCKMRFCALNVMWSVTARMTGVWFVAPRPYSISRGCLAALCRRTVPVWPHQNPQSRRSWNWCWHFPRYIESASESPLSGELAMPSRYSSLECRRSRDSALIFFFFRFLLSTAGWRRM